MAEACKLANAVPDPLGEVLIDVLRFVALVNQENSAVVVLVADAASYDLIHFAESRYFVPVVALDPQRRNCTLVHLFANLLHAVESGQAFVQVSFL